jgi:hypothetical protein
VSQTYTSDTLRVSHDEITSHTTPSDINVLSAQARWQGVDAPVTDYYGDSNGYHWNTATDTADPLTPSDEGTTITQNFPSFSGSFRFHTAKFVIDILTPARVEYDYEIYDSNDNLIDSGNDVVDYLNREGSGEETHYNNISQRHDDGYQELTLTNIELGSDEDEAYAKSYTHSAWKTSTTKSTQDPFVTRDVDASYTGTLSDGEWSTWQSMTGLVEGTNEFYHNISGSEEAYFEFEYTYEETYPTVQKQFRLYDEDQNAIHKVALADPSDSQLDYNHHRYALNDTVYALDVVDPSDENAIDWVKWYHPTHGEYCPRAYDTIQL